MIYAVDLQWLGCELNPAYADMQKRRTQQTAMVLA